MITIKHLRKEYPNVVPLEDVNVTINDGDIISVIGPSGTGKSTFIRCINMMDIPTSGEIIVDGININDKKCNINEVRKKMGMVFQTFNLFENFTVLENVMRAPIDLLKMDRQEAYDHAIELLRMVGMEKRAFDYPSMLSGGQKQRVAIARTLSMDPEIILFDEPTSALDPTMVGEVQTVIRELAKMGKTMMIVTHEMNFAREISNRVFYMDAGGIYEDGTPKQIFEAPQKELTRRFIRRLKVFEETITPDDFNFIEITTRLNQYAYKNSLPIKLVNHIHAFFEELCQETLMSHIEKPQIKFTVEYDEANSRAFATVLYNGENFDPRNSEDMISLAIIRRFSENLNHSYLGGEPYSNKITADII